MNTEIVSLAEKRTQLAQRETDILLENYRDLIARKMTQPTRKISEIDTEFFEWSKNHRQPISKEIVEKLVELIQWHPLSSLDHSTMRLFISNIKQVPYWELSDLKETLCHELELNNLNELDNDASPFIIEILRGRYMHN
jgi:hypothetical protein